MDKLKVVVNWYSGLTKRGKSLVIIATAAVVFFILESIKS